MRIATMNWAWTQQLAPTAKLVLMSLADAADDQGICWPSVPTVASKCCVSTRTVRRIIQKHYFIFQAVTSETNTAIKCGKYILNPMEILTWTPPLHKYNKSIIF